MCKKWFSIESRNARLQKRLDKKESVAKNKELKMRLAYAEDMSHVYNDYLADRKADRKIKKTKRNAKKIKAKNIYETAKTELDLNKHIRSARKLEKKRYKRETRKMRTVSGTNAYKSYKQYGGGYYDSVSDKRGNSYSSAPKFFGRTPF